MYFTQKVMGVFALSEGPELSSSDAIRVMRDCGHIHSIEEHSKKVRVALSRLVKSGLLTVSGQHRHKKYRLATEAA